MRPDDSCRSAIEADQIEPVAIIGIGCRFPGGADTAEAYWRLLVDGVDAITEVPDNRWDIDSYYHEEPVTPGRMSTRWGGFLEDIDMFDAELFGISPREAARMDPQQRLVLEVAWEALENAGVAPSSLARSRTGCYVGISSNDYLRLQAEDEQQIDAYLGTGGALSITANRLSYILDLRGPSLVVDTACSSSLVAVHLACQSLRSKECDLALAGGVNLILSPDVTITFSHARMMAADGRCKTFDASADGYVRGEGCGVVVLKRLSEAIADQDCVLAAVRSSAVNQDGRSNGLTAPNGLAQQAVIRDALARAGIDARQVGFVEAHGTGTPLGDPIEVEALRGVLLKDRSPEHTCYLGSVKSNIGHLEAAAGVAGLIKAALVLERGLIPPQIHLSELNPRVRIKGTPIEIPIEPRAWPCSSISRIAGVSSFGFGGTNAHVILEQPPRQSRSSENTTMAGKAHGDRAPGFFSAAARGVAENEDRPLLLPLSARSEVGLGELARRYCDFLERAASQTADCSDPAPAFRDICVTAATGRTHQPHRLAVVAESAAQASRRLSGVVKGTDPEGVSIGHVERKRQPAIAFLFTGQGSQYPGVGKALYHEQPLFRETLDRCDEVLRRYLQKPLLSVLFADQADPESELLNQTAYTQPALFALEIALANLWSSWGVTPRAVMGHSVGEIAAACFAGVFSLEDGLRLIAERARLMQSLPAGGGMAAVMSDESTVTRVIEPFSDLVSMAALNGPRDVVISGDEGALDAVIEQLESEGTRCRRLRVSHAFHSPLMDPALDELEEISSSVSTSFPAVRFVSNLDGELMFRDRAPDASHWRRHAREPVSFAAGMKLIEQTGAQIFLEIGPSPTLLAMGKRCLEGTQARWVPSLRKNREERDQLLESAAALYCEGVDLSWQGLCSSWDSEPRPRRVVHLPTYPFQREHHWFEEPKGSSPRAELAVRAGEEHSSAPAAPVSPDEKAAEPGETTHVPELVRELRGMAARRRFSWLLSDLSRRVARVLGLGSDARVDADQPLMDLGLDSLMALELRDSVRQRLGHELPSTLMFDYPSISAITSYILEEVLEAELGEAGEGSPALQARAAAEPSELDAQVSDDDLGLLSDEEIKRLIGEELEHLSNDLSLRKEP